MFRFHIVPFLPESGKRLKQISIDLHLVYTFTFPLPAFHTHNTSPPLNLNKKAEHTEVSSFGSSTVFSLKDPPLSVPPSRKVRLYRD
jgi:hypothetical protein